MNKNEFKQLHENVKAFLASNNKINEDSYQQASVDLYKKQLDIAQVAMYKVFNEASKKENNAIGLANAARKILDDIEYWLDNTNKLPPR